MSNFVFITERAFTYSTYLTQSLFDISSSENFQEIAENIYDQSVTSLGLQDTEVSNVSLQYPFLSVDLVSRASKWKVPS